MNIEEGRKKRKVKYKYALDEFKRIIFIEDLENSKEIRQQVFTCISCGNTLIPKLGKIKQKHFAHKHVCDCSLETYLHRLAKEVFEKEYNE
jgi:competence CoiA-like predicted nuclease